jgi:hypothetical protein
MKSVFCFFFASLLAVSSFAQVVISFKDNGDPLITKISGFKGSNLFTDDGIFKARSISLVVFSKKYLSENELYLWLGSKQIKTSFNSNEYEPIGQLIHTVKTALYKTPDRSSTRGYLTGIKEIELLRKVDGFYYVELRSDKGYIPASYLLNLEIVKVYLDASLELKQQEFEKREEEKQRILEQQEKYIFEAERKKSELEKKKREERIQKKKAEDQETNEKYKLALIKLYGSSDAQRILDHKYWLGMTEGMALESIGSPSVNNVSEDARGIRKQWVYRDLNKYGQTKDVYLYFDNGLLKSIQD